MRNRTSRMVNLREITVWMNSIAFRAISDEWGDDELHIKRGCPSHVGDITGQIP